MSSRFRHVFGVVFFLLIAAGGGGCSSGCGGCAGTTPLPGGFAKDKAIANAVAVRISRPGLSFIEKELPAIVSRVADAKGGVLAFNIPNVNPDKTQIANLSIFGKVYLDPNVCAGGPNPNANPPRCRATVGIAKSTFQIDAVKPNAITLRATIPVQVDNTPIDAEVSYDPPFFGAVNLGGITLRVAYGDGGCKDGIPHVTPHALPVAITLPLVEETTAPRNGYTKIDVGNAKVDLDGLSDNDVHVCSSCGFASGICSAITDSGFVKSLVLGPLRNGLEDQVRSLLADQLCTAPNPTQSPPCPTSTSPDAQNKHCVFDSDKNKCVSALLGMDGRANLGGLLESISPGTTGGVEFGLASAGAMKPFPNANADVQGRTANGVSLGMLGGVVPRSPSACVPQAALKLPTGIPFPDELAPTGNESPTTPHVGIALAGRFLEYSFGNLYNSGLLCLGVSSEQVDMLRSGLLSILIPSLKTLTFEQGDAPVAIATRPQAPPTVKLGGGTGPNDALLNLTLPKLAIDFYLWHLERYVRVFTYQADFTIPINLQTGKKGAGSGAGGIVPSIGEIKVQNAAVTNADLLMEDPALVSVTLSGLLGGLGKQLVGNGLSPIDLSSVVQQFGLGLEIGKIGKLTKGTDEFVGIFASLTKAAGAATLEADTKVRLVSKKVPLDHMQLGTMDRGSLPELIVDVSSSLDDAQQPVEYSWWIDGGSRSAWAPDRHIVLRDDQLLLQGRHMLRVAARVAGVAASEDATPAELPFTIDALAPSVTVERSESVALIRAWDVVSAEAALVGRYRLDGDEYGNWVPVVELARVAVGTASTIDVEIKDEEGNVRTVSQQLIRGKTDGSLGGAGAGCGCSAVGSSGPRGSTSGFAAAGLALLTLVGLGLRRRAGASGLPRANAAALALVTIAAVAATSQGCACGSEAEGTTGCGDQCNAECRAPLPLGLPGSYTSLAKAPDGTIWVAGYNDALLSEGDSQLFGDLVVGKYDLGKERVQWQTVDGLPARAEGTCAERPSDTWRNGESDSGDDVGLYTSMQIGADGHPMVSYYDATNKKLKLAIESDGWKVLTVKEQVNADIGRYAKMVLVGGKPVIAFLQIEPGNAGKTRSKVIIARSNVESPTGANDFRFEDAAVEEANPCSAAVCGNQVCVKSTGACAATISGCTPTTCPAGQACVNTAGKATCVAVKGSTQTYPEVFGDFISLAQGGGKLGMVVYDRPHGNLVALAEQSEGKWARSTLDGETGSRKDKTAIDTGDVGVAASLMIDAAGKWHVSYVSGLDETLRYLTVTGGKPGTPEIVDTGTSVDGKPITNGKHVVGDDSAIRVEGDIVTVYYQDATIGTLRRATGAKTSTGYKWDLRTLPQPNKFGGFYPQFVPGEDKVANFWEQTDRATKTRIGDVAILAP